MDFDYLYVLQDVQRGGPVTQDCNRSPFEVTKGRTAESDATASRTVSNCSVILQSSHLQPLRVSPYFFCELITQYVHSIAECRSCFGITPHRVVASKKLHALVVLCALAVFQVGVLEGRLLA